MHWPKQIVGLERHGAEHPRGDSSPSESHGPQRTTGRHLSSLLPIPGSLDLPVHGAGSQGRQS